MNDDFYGWKRHPITQAVMSEFKARIAYLMQEMVDQAASGDPRELAVKAGAIRAYQDVLEIQVEETQNAD